eukprot:g34194.t1
MHKPDCPGQPIVAAFSCPTELISNYLDCFFPTWSTNSPPLSETPPTPHLLQDFQFPCPQHLIFTVDTSIPHADGLKALCFFLSCRSQQSPSTDTFIRLTELVPTLNNFSFNSSNFLQNKRVAMGTRMGPSYACLFTEYMEQPLFCCYTGTIPHLFFHYIDDCIGSASCSHEELEQFINFTNTFHPKFKFTWTISNTSLSLLDFSISIS